MNRIFCLFAVLSAPLFLFADTVNIPVIKPISYFQGTACDPLLLSDKDAIDASVLNDLDSIIDSENKLGVADMHKTKALLVRHEGRVVKTKISVVVTHGLLNSPYWMRWIAEKAHRLGINVINARLPSHFQGERADLDKFNHLEAIQQGQKIADLAEQLGEKVVYIGHSTGGAVSIFSAINNLNKTAGLILFSPSLQVHPNIRHQTDALTMVGVSGWLMDLFSRAKPSATDRYMSTWAGVEVAEMSDELAAATQFEEGSDGRPYGLVRQKLNGLPILWFDTPTDATIDFETNKEVAGSLENTEHVVFPADLNIIHNATATKTAGQSTNATAKWMKFLKSFL